MLKDLLYIDFLYTKTYIYSLALQAVTERAMNYKKTTGLADQLLSATPNLHPRDSQFIQDAMDASRAVLNTIVKLAPTGMVRFLPVRVYVRVISVCILLLKVGRSTLNKAVEFEVNSDTQTGTRPGGLFGRAKLLTRSDRAERPSPTYPRRGRYAFSGNIRIPVRNIYTRV